MKFEIVEGSFSAVSTPNVASKYSLESSWRDLLDKHIFATLQTKYIIFLNLVTFWSQTRQLIATTIVSNIALIKYIKISFVRQYSPWTSIAFPRTLLKAPTFPLLSFKSNGSGRRLFAPTIGHKRHWTLREFSRRLAAPVVLVLSVGFVINY